MYRGKKLIAIIPACDEEEKIADVVERIDAHLVDTILVVDDGSTDATADVARRKGATVISTGKRTGVGAAIRRGMQFARDAEFEVGVILAGNNKDEPDEIPKLVDPICDDRADLVIGSRYLPGGSSGGDMPFYRKLATRLHPWLMGLFCGKPLSETTNGFRAFRLSLLDDQRLRLDQRWLDTYGLEVYFLWKVITLGYQHAEVPCTKIYPPRSLGITKMRPIIDWWSILSPIFLLGLKIRN